MVSAQKQREEACLPAVLAGGGERPVRVTAVLPIRAWGWRGEPLATWAPVFYFNAIYSLLVNGNSPGPSPLGRVISSDPPKVSPHFNFSSTTPRRP